MNRFWDKVDKNGPLILATPCWLWIASRNSYNYGRFWFQRRLLYAQRFAYELVVGPIPKGMITMHECDNPPCVNPSHLKLGTNKQNSEDAKIKGRFKRHMPFIDPDKKTKLYQMIKEGRRQEFIVKSLGLSPKTVNRHSQIVRSKNDG